MKQTKTTPERPVRPEPEIKPIIPENPIVPDEPLTMPPQEPKPVKPVEVPEREK